ncbi:hypothetical protein HELRODRAFT_194720 [Helobdella robusta]|uniref:DAZ-associated protein 2 n=1 Tax=Helobdella robusta TaxID=6412 RepID=T1FWC4_HELRO|nr:hypothetical protein HELRODRAFT_194720 [Helobdella robusta]ESN90019.1 hypothetical protein HELRODRAFT_194720 [Helobdella robusta]
MPLFSKKPKEKKEKEGLPQQSSYPRQAAPSTFQPQQPPYSAGYPPQQPPFNAGYPPQPPYNTGYLYSPQPPPPYSAEPCQQSYAAPVQAVPPPTVVVHGGFDAGARFDGNTPARIPNNNSSYDNDTNCQPPPPGAFYHPAQAAAAAGCQVQISQQNAGYFTGGSDGATIFYNINNIEINIINYNSINNNIINNNSNNNIISNYNICNNNISNNKK